MARQILVFPEPLVNADTQAWTVSGVFWLAAPVNNQRPLPGYTSMIPLATAPGATTWGVQPLELGSLQNGTVVEQPFTFTLPVAGLAPAAINSALGAKALTDFNAAQAALVARIPSGKLIGSSYSTPGGWTVGP